VTTSMVSLMTFHSSSSGRTDLETDLLPWVTHSEFPRDASGGPADMRLVLVEPLIRWSAREVSAVRRGLSHAGNARHRSLIG
jgi:hypothetical protein